MSDIVASGRSSGPIKMFLSALLGASVFLPATEIQAELGLAPSAPARHLAQMSCPIPASAIVPGIKALAHDIARRFHVRESAAILITHAAFSAARVQGIDPTLVLAVTAIESKFKAGAVNSTSGAIGLMQVLPQYHPHEVLNAGGEPSLLLIAPNINVGAAILAGYLDVADGDIEGALGHYVGAAGADHYIHLVQREMAHMTHVVDATAAK
jgi:soluble lytic murein transglycosylase-like protein